MENTKLAASDDSSLRGDLSKALEDKGALQKEVQVCPLYNCGVKHEKWSEKTTRQRDAMWIFH